MKFAYFLAAAFLESSIVLGVWGLTVLWGEGDAPSRLNMSSGESVASVTLIPFPDCRWTLDEQVIPVPDFAPEDFRDEEKAQTDREEIRDPLREPYEVPDFMEIRRRSHERLSKPTAPPPSTPAVADTAEVAPVEVHTPPPRYPRLAIRRGYEGTAIVEFEVRADGSCGRIRLVESSGFTCLDRAAIEAVKEWRFEPAADGGTNVHFSVDFAFRSRLFESLAGQMFDRALRRMTGAFEQRAAALYGISRSSAQSAA